MAAAIAKGREVAAQVTESLATVNGCTRFAHPFTGFELPQGVHFAPSSCVVLDGKGHAPPRGLLFYLATGGGELAGAVDEGTAEYVNPGDTPAWLKALDRRIAELQTRIDREDAEIYDLQTVLWDLEANTLHTHAQILEMLTQARHGLASTKQLEDHLISVASLADPMPSRVDDIRRAIAKQHTSIDETIRQAKESESLLSRHEVLQSALQELLDQSPLNTAELKRLQANRSFIATHGFVKVTSSGWQRGVHEDVLSWSPTYSWSDYCWEPVLSPAHPQALPAGAWFEIELPEGMQITPTHYSLRHGDDGCSTAPGLRHDSNCAHFAHPSEALQGVGAPLTSWGSTTRAKRAFNGTALLNWQVKFRGSQLTATF